VRKGFLISLGVVVILAIVASAWWLPAYRESKLQNQIASIEAMEDLAAKKEAALGFLLGNQMADRRVLLRALDAATDVHRDSEDKEPLIELFQNLYEQDLTPWLHYRVMARLDRGLMELGTAESVARAEEVAREILDVDDAPMETYHWIVYFHQASDLADPELTVDVALAAWNAIDRDEYGMWPQMLNMAYTRLVGSVHEDEGLAAAVTLAETLAGRTDNPSALAALNAAVFRAAIEEDEDTAVAAAQAIAELEGLTSSDPMNGIAYDMAERGLAPEVAIALGRQALEHAASRYDSTMVLDTVGWAYYAAGDFEEASGYLRAAVRLMDETPTYHNETIQHLLAAYDGGAMVDEAIDFLALVVAKSVDEDDPARARLSELLVGRDGSDEAIAAMITEHRYDGTEQAPSFNLESRTGEMVSLEGLKGDILVVCFWSYG
jgi:tetratricopeptide (TPR) repeat protein